MRVAGRREQRTRTDLLRRGSRAPRRAQARGSPGLARSSASCQPSRLNFSWVSVESKTPRFARSPSFIARRCFRVRGAPCSPEGRLANEPPRAPATIPPAAWLPNNPSFGPSPSHAPSFEAHDCCRLSIHPEVATRFTLSHSSCLRRAPPTCSSTRAFLPPADMVSAAP